MPYPSPVPIVCWINGHNKSALLTEVGDCEHQMRSLQQMLSTVPVTQTIPDDLAV